MVSKDRVAESGPSLDRLGPGLLALQARSLGRTTGVVRYRRHKNDKIPIVVRNAFAFLKSWRVRESWWNLAREGGES
jgi:hypothetical protein